MGEPTHGQVVDTGRGEVGCDIPRQATGGLQLGSAVDGGHHAPEDSLSLWCPEPPDYFIQNAEAAN